ncbi:MAG TPA: glycosyltransferase [Methanoregulaceae archaeon]|nr:glycosyltransferase [Methanoregulaceae archaeon]
MKNALLVAYEYPPIGGIGVIRSVKFSKYLPEFSWQPHVLTVANPDRFYTTVTNEQVPSGVTVHRVYNLLNNLSIIEGALRRLHLPSRAIVPDIYRGWVGPAIRQGRRIIADQSIDLIYVTVSPFSSSEIGVRLKMETGLPFVLDLRDAWTLAPNPIEYLHESLRKRDDEYEKRAIHAADRIITATEGIAEQYAEKYPSESDKIVPILNGFDCDDIPNHVEPFSKFTIIYTGFFYGAQSPKTLVKALERIVKNRLIPADEIQFLWAGRDAPWVRAMFRSAGIERIVKYLGLVPKAEADALLYRSHLLFFLLGENERVSQKRILTGKIFPYLASGRQILALVPNGDAARLISEFSDDAVIISNDSIDEVTAAIVDAYHRWQGGDATQHIGPKTREFRRRNNYRVRTQELAAVFDSLTGR